MNEIISTESVMRVSKFAHQINKSVAWVRKLGNDGLIDIVEVDGFYFVRINSKFHSYIKS